MRRHLLFIAAAALLLAANAPKKEDAPKKEETIKKELASFQGTWLVVATEDKSGKKRAEDTNEVVKLTIKDDKFTITTDGKVTFAGTFKQDPTKKPKTIDLKFTKGLRKGYEIRGIYEMDGDKRKSCLNLRDGGDRPEKFMTGDDCLIIEYKREKPAK
jgi:uncharacterized protein (TIGR03067 family)